MALLRLPQDASNVRVIAGSTRAQRLDLAMIRHLGVEPIGSNAFVKCPG